MGDRGLAGRISFKIQRKSKARFIAKRGRRIIYGDFTLSLIKRKRLKKFRESITCTLEEYIEKVDGAIKDKEYKETVGLKGKNIALGREIFSIFQGL